MTRRIISWLLVLFWMALMFSASTDEGSAAHTSRFIEPFLRWLLPRVSLEAIDQIHFLIRKTAHLTVYAILAALCFRAVFSQRAAQGRAWSWKTAALALIISVSYAAADEFHQSFIPSRGASVSDVLLDTCGAAAGLSVIYALRRRRMLSIP